LIEQGEYWRLVSANFLHAGYLHLLLNGASLYAVGPTLEKLYGTPKYLAIYLFAGISGALASFAFNLEAPSTGASGALFGLLGAMLLIGLRHRDAIPDHQKLTMRDSAVVMLILNLGFGFAHRDVIDNYAHLGGLVGGAAAAAALGPHPQLLGRRLARWMRPFVAVWPLLVTGALGYGLFHTLSGQVSSIRLEGPTNDFSVTLPLLDIRQTKTALIDYTFGDQHYVRIDSMPNPAPKPAGDRPPLSEATLERYAPLLAEKLLREGARFDPRGAVVSYGQHRYLRLMLSEPAREELYVTASPTRLYVISTKGLQAQPWVRRGLDQALATFRFKTP
jgi:membrane associated rhomboid family serine protease